ncbi:heme NO-binding domain-containing protein [Shimia thalassica]|nr:heme NO-binding domain-containing protein [Shimia thalassica]MBU2941227.1 heme NO-binding domain-containing protein [Shimia thalassica]MDO6503289.1 heme NO-binding domain-containing protein [Shimia thalassica]MDP2494679.1 heme NO-binding domain-containing protein [Shimia thalassica]MDP2518446.1 heme NO-binding domain-containing protein [Shimia thalassica]
MKGVVFVELLSMAESAFGEATVDNVLDEADLDNGGAFTAVGNYPCDHLIKLVEGFSEKSGASPEALQQKFGFWMLDFFEKGYSDFFVGKENSFDMLEAIDTEIHVEVLKLYPEAELPSFTTERFGDNQFEMVYSSPRPLVEFCQGLIEACIERFKETATIERTAVPNQPNSTRFLITLTS